MTGFRVNEPNVVYETFDEEIIVVNLDTGNYYSLSGTGPKIWIDLAHGFSMDEIVRRIQSRHTGEFDVIAAAVGAFADRLVNEELLVRAADVVARPQTTSVEPTESKTPFAAPLIENYEDMQDLLMLDPIHDVDPAGWPVAKKNS
jgi:hypothetical protein